MALHQPAARPFVEMLNPLDPLLLPTPLPFVESPNRRRLAEPFGR